MPQRGAGTESVQYRYNVVLLALSWCYAGCTGTVLVLRWYCICTTLLLHKRSCDTAHAQEWYYLGAIPVLHSLHLRRLAALDCIDTAQARQWYCSGTGHVVYPYYPGKGLVLHW